MTFTALHQALGCSPGPLTDEMVTEAVASGVEETAALDWKEALPKSKGLAQGDLPKDIAAMANSGGGLIVYGVAENEKKEISHRVDVANFDESFEHAIRRMAISAISPPIFDLKFHCPVPENERAVAIEVPASVDGPHLIYKDEYFGAPLRTGASTNWMKEREIEAAYRARFAEQRRATETLEALYTETAESRVTTARPWLIAVGTPRLPEVHHRLSREKAREIFMMAEKITMQHSVNNGTHPLEHVNQMNPRPGLRRWVAADQAVERGREWAESWASAHHDGSVTVAMSAGGHRRSYDGYREPWEVESRTIESVVADFLALLRATAQTQSRDEYDVRVGVAWSGEDTLKILTIDNMGQTYSEVSTPLHRYTPVRSTITPAEDVESFHEQLVSLAEDCVNQGGITYLHTVQTRLYSSA